MAQELTMCDLKLVAAGQVWFYFLALNRSEEATCINVNNVMPVHFNANLNVMPVVCKAPQQACKQARAEPSLFVSLENAGTRHMAVSIASITVALYKQCSACGVH